MALRDTREPVRQQPEFSAAEIGALAHLYRGEVYRSTAWRTRLDSTTNWAVVTTGIALSALFSSAQASPLPMVLVGLIVTLFLLFEARRYRYFNVWRARARLLETDFYAPMIRGEGIQLGAGWTELLAKDYCDPRYHISFVRAVGRRLCRASCAKLAEVIEPYLAQSAQFADAGPFTLSIALADLCCFVSRSLFAGTGVASSDQLEESAGGGSGQSG